MMQNALAYSIFGNFLIDYLASFALFLVGALLIFAFKKYLLSRLRAWSATTETSLDDLLVVAASKAIPILYTGVFFLSMHALNFSATFEKVLENTIIVLVTMFAVRALISTFNVGLQTYLHKSADATGGENQLKGIRGLINFAI